MGMHEIFVCFEDLPVVNTSCSGSNKS